MMPGTSMYVRAKDIAEYFDVSTIAVYQWCTKGFLAYFRVANGHKGHIRIKRADLNKFEEAFTHPATKNIGGITTPAARYLAGLGPRPEGFNGMD